MTSYFFGSDNIYTKDKPRATPSPCTAKNEIQANLFLCVIFSKSVFFHLNMSHIYQTSSEKCFKLYKD